MTLLGLFALLAAISLPACLSGTNPRSCSWDDAAGGEGACREPDVPSSYNFTIEPKHFALDGKRIALLSGSLHYWRVPPEYWKRTLEALRDMGLNTVETYVPWSLHQPHPSPESITFDGPLDVLRFLRLARSLGLMVIFRPGPYICSEMDLGGLPSWLLAKGALLRTADERYLEAVDVWFGRLIPLVAPLQVTLGGPIIMVQVENEFGHRMMNGTEYLGRLVTILRGSGIEVPLMTSDGMTNPEQIFWGGHIGRSKEHLFRTVNFGAALGMRAGPALDILAAVQPKMPLTAMELWCGWFDHWGAPSHAKVQAKDVLDDVDVVLRRKGSFNLYMFHGGTNWGFTTGSLVMPTRPQYVTTSYDYDAPLAEGGLCTPKYSALKKRLWAWKKKNPELGRLGLEPLATSPFEEDTEEDERFSCDEARGSKASVGRIEMQEWLPLLDCPDALPDPIFSKHPLTMERMPIHDGGGQGSGLILYRAKLRSLAGAETAAKPQPQEIEVSGMRDRAQLWLSSRPAQAPDAASSKKEQPFLVPPPSWRSVGLAWERMTEMKPRHMDLPQAPANGGETPPPADEDMAEVEDQQERKQHDTWLELLVENLGRVFMTQDFERHLQEHRGVEKVRVRKKGGSKWTSIQNWEMIPLEFDAYHLAKISSSGCWRVIDKEQEGAEQQGAKKKPDAAAEGEGRPVLFRAVFHLPDGPPGDQWVDTFTPPNASPGATGPWRKGAVFVNGFNLGRFWPSRGPQRYLYLPAPLLRGGDNELLVLELHQRQTPHPGSRPSLKLVTHSEL